MLNHNSFCEKLQRGQPTLGTHFLFSDADIPELIGDTGQFDYAEFSAEYSTFDMNLLYHLARSGQCGDLPLMIKLDRESQGFWAQAAIGAGFQAILFTDIRSPADVHACYSCIRPDFPGSGGTMGVKLRRPALSGYHSNDYLSHLESVVFGIMIEKSVAVENLPTIMQAARQRGVAFTQWGPADFQFSLGAPAQELTGEERPLERETTRKQDEKPDEKALHPTTQPTYRTGSSPKLTPGKLQDIEEYVIHESHQAGIPARIEIARPDQAERFLKLGVRHFCIGWDRFIYQQAITELGLGMRDMLKNV